MKIDKGQFNLPDVSRVLDPYRPHMLPKCRSDLIMSGAMGMPCTARVASFLGMKCDGRDTGIGAHLTRQGKGMSTKVTDLGVAYTCFTCHMIIDGVDPQWRDGIVKLYPVAYYQRLLEAVVETHTLQAAQGILIVPDAEWVG